MYFWLQNLIQDPTLLFVVMAPSPPQPCDSFTLVFHDIVTFQECWSLILLHILGLFDVPPWLDWGHIHLARCCASCHLGKCIAIHYTRGYMMSTWPWSMGEDSVCQVCYCEVNMCLFIRYKNPEKCNLGLGKTPSLRLLPTNFIIHWPIVLLTIIALL